MGEYLSPGSSHSFINRVLNLLLDRFSKAKQSYVAGQLTKIVTIAKNQDVSFLTSCSFILFSPPYYSVLISVNLIFSQSDEFR